MKVIMEGDKSTIAKIMQENKLRENRGLVSFSEAEEPEAEQKGEVIKGRKKAEPEAEQKGIPEVETKEL